MNVVFPDAGLLYILEKTIGTGLVYDLYRNDVTPGTGSVLADFLQGNWSGYASVNVPASAWNVKVVQGDVGKYEAPMILFGNSSASPATAYGYFVKDSTNTVLLAAVRFDLAPVMIPRGGVYPVQPLLGVFSGAK